MGIATQEFRDGAASGADAVSRRVGNLIAWGVHVDERIVAQIAKGVAHEMGGSAYHLDAVVNGPVKR